MLYPTTLFDLCKKNPVRINACGVSMVAWCGFWPQELGRENIHFPTTTNWLDRTDAELDSSSTKPRENIKRKKPF